MKYQELSLIQEVKECVLELKVVHHILKYGQ